MIELFVYTIKIEGNDMAALSFLRPDEVAQYGLPAEAVLGEVDPRRPNMTVDGFSPNDAFLNFLHNFIKQTAPELPSLRVQAEKVRNGPVYVVDRRTANRGERPPFEDVIGWFGVHNGEILVDTYNPSPSYQLLSNAGPFALEEPLEQLLLERVRTLASQVSNGDS